MIARILGAAALVVAAGAGACSCEPPAGDKKLPAVGELRAVVVEGGVDLRLDTTDARVRELQVKVALTDAEASDVTAIGNTDLVEDGLTEPKSTFVVVVGDTRRVLLPEGGIVHIATNAAPSKIELGKALAVDERGRKRTLKVVVP